MGHVILKYREDRERGAHTTAQQVLVLDEDVEPLIGAIQQCLEQGGVLAKNVLRLLVTLLSPPTNTKQCHNKENEGPSFNQHRSNGDIIVSQTGGKTPSDSYPVLALQSALSAEKWFNLFLSILEDTQPQPETCGFGWATVTFFSRTQTLSYLLHLQIYHILSQQDEGTFLLHEPLWSRLLGTLQSSLSYGDKFIGCKKYALLSLSHLLSSPQAVEV
jgi:hypothetical protein